MKPFITLVTLIFGISLLFSPFTQTASAEARTTVLVFPFTIHAPDDQAFIQQAVLDMLRTRLSGKNLRVEVAQGPVDAGTLSDPKAVAMGLEKSADYVLVGSLTMLGSAVSTDARLIRTADLKVVLTFSQTGQGEGAVIEHTDALASRITGEPLTSQKSAAPMPPPQPTPIPPAAGTPQDRSEQGIQLTYWKSEDFKAEIRSLAIGDVDADQQQEIVFVDSRQIYVYRWVNGRFDPVAKISEKAHNEFFRVDVADINQNGKAEIFVTNYLPGLMRLRSFVLEWNGTAFEKISQNADWYYRVSKSLQKPNRLLGQKGGLGHSIVSIKDALFGDGVYELQWRESAYVPGARQNLPDSLTIYGHAAGDLLNNGQQKIVAFTSRNYLRVLNADGDVEWESDKPYGGSRFFIEVPDTDDINRSVYFYFPQRIFVTDFDKDGTQEIIVVKNHDAAGALARVKYFNKGGIECLSYDALGAQLKWQTREISGYISDYTIGDVDSDGQEELVFASVTKKESGFSKGLSAVIAASISHK